MNVDDTKPYFESVEHSERYVSSQAYTYNHVGISYNEVGVEYGGLYGNEGESPNLTITDYKPL
jgi:hypothetical protein